MNKPFALPVPQRGEKLTDEQAMCLAISEAYKGILYAAPNPLVGAVVLDKENRFLSSGYHEKYGGPHAEVNAFKGLSEAELRDARVFVTLEPCAHEGKTPSCAKMMAKYSLSHVTVGLVDPNPLVSGQGIEILKNAGIAVSLYTDSVDSQETTRAELEQVCEVFLFNYRQKKAFVALKIATSLDGQVALKNGESKWITGAESRHYVHFLRASYDAIMVGKGTVLHDNPSLNIRRSDIVKTNKVVVLDSKGELLKNTEHLNIFKNHSLENIFWCLDESQKSQEEFFKKTGVNILFCRSKNGSLDLEHILELLFQHKVYSVFIEGGARLASEALNCGIVNRLYLFQAPIIMGSGGSQSWTETISIGSMQDRLSLDSPKLMTFGNDVMVTGVFKKTQ